MENRYNRYYKYGDVKFYLADFKPTPERCRFLMLKVLEQAVREYCALRDSDIPSEQATWELARDFLFDNSYRFMWGDRELSLETFLDHLDLDIEWVRKQTCKRGHRSGKEKRRRNNKI